MVVNQYHNNLIIFERIKPGDFPEANPRRFYPVCILIATGIRNLQLPERHPDIIKNWSNSGIPIR